MEEYLLHPFGKRVVIVCDEDTLSALLDRVKEGWVSHNEFMHVIEEIVDVFITPEQLLHNMRMSDRFVKNYVIKVETP